MRGFYLPRNKTESILRVIDANLNRLREALRVIEEYFRFINLDKNISTDLKLLRHSLEELEKNFDQKAKLVCIEEIEPGDEQ